MATIGLILGPVLALLGVWLGAFISSQYQRKQWQRDRDVFLTEQRLAAYRAFLASTKHLSLYAKDPRSKIQVVTPDGSDFPILLTDERGIDRRAALETATADLLLLARSSETMVAAGTLRAALNGFLAARAVHDAGCVPAPIVEALREAEQLFVNAAREDAASSILNESLWPERYLEMREANLNADVITHNSPRN